MAIVWLNTEYYTITQLILFGIGAVLWLVNYGVLIRNVFKKQFVEMPAGVLCANFAWEFTWGFLYTNNMGFALDLGYKAWFVFDAFIIYGFYRYGYKQVQTGVIPYYRLLFTFALASWAVILYFFVQQGYDNPIGGNSAYVINLLISSLYILMYLRLEDKSLLSFTAAWTKWLGTGFISLMCILRWPENHFLISMAIICFMLDVFYFVLIIKDRRKPVSHL